MDLLKYVHDFVNIVRIANIYVRRNNSEHSGDARVFRKFFFVVIFDAHGQFWLIFKHVCFFSFWALVAWLFCYESIWFLLIFTMLFTFLILC